jgi:hypothetical protein
LSFSLVFDERLTLYGSHAEQFDLILSTVNVKLVWNAYLEALKPRGPLQYVGAILRPLDLGLSPFLMGTALCFIFFFGQSGHHCQNVGFCGPARHSASHQNLS